MMITPGFLRGIHACHSHARKFEEMWPDGCEVTLENAQAALDAGIDALWLIDEMFYRGKPLTDITGWLYKDGDRGHYVRGVLHREEGPAVVWENGEEFWYRNGEFIPEDYRYASQK